MLDLSSDSPIEVLDYATFDSIISSINESLPSRDKIPFARPYWGQREKEHIDRVIDSGYGTRGPEVERLEGRLSERFDRPVIATDTCTNALSLAYRLACHRKLGTHPNSRIPAGAVNIITTPVTSPLTISPMVALGIRPKFVDVDQSTMNINPGLIESAIDQDTIAIAPVHIGGMPCDMEEINLIARENGLLVIEDAAHAFASRLPSGEEIGAVSGSFATCFSFYSTKTFGSFEGGALVLDNSITEEELEILIGVHHKGDVLGASHKDVRKVFRPPSPNCMGLVMNMTDPQAAILGIQLDKENEILERRTELASVYSKLLFPLVEAGFIRLISDASSANGTFNSRYLYQIMINPNTLRIDRDTFCTALIKLGVGVGLHFPSILDFQDLPREEYNFNSGGLTPEDLPIATLMSRNTLSLPLYPSLTVDDVSHVAEVLDSVCKEFAK